MSLISNYEYIRDWCNHRFLKKSDQVTVDLSNYYTKSEVDNTVQDAVQDATSSIDLSNYYTQAQVDNKLVWKAGSASNAGVVTKNGSNTSSGAYAVAEGQGTTASGQASHAEGLITTANGTYSHAEGERTTASGRSSHAEGAYTVAQNEHEHASGSYNKSTQTSINFGDAGNTSFSHGIGTSSANMKNAIEIMENGDMYVYGIGSYTGANYSSATTLQDVINNAGAQADWSATSGNSQILHKPNIYSFVCSTAAGTATKVATTNWDSDVAIPYGTVVAIYFNNTNTASVSSLSLKVGTTVGSIKRSVNGSLVNLRSTDSLKTKETYWFNYDGTYWVLMNDDTTPGTITTTSTTGLSTATNESLSGSISLHKVSKTGSYNDLLNTPTIPTTTSSVTSGSTAALTSGGAYTALSAKEDTSNKVTSISSSSTDTQYPSAKAVYTQIGNIESVLDTIINPSPYLSLELSEAGASRLAPSESTVYTYNVIGSYLTGNVTLSIDSSSQMNNCTAVLSTTSVAKNSALAGYTFTVTITANSTVDTLLYDNVVIKATCGSVSDTNDGAAISYTNAS